MSGRPERAFFSTFLSRKKANFRNNKNFVDKTEKFKLFYEDRNKIDI